MTQTLTILGPGLLGASVALAARRAGWQGAISVWARRAASCDEALERGVCDRASERVEEACEGASLVVLATPVGAMSELALRVKQAVAADAVVTDVGSVKTAVVAALEPVLGGRFVGAHPMAGDDKTGMVHGRSDLFEGACCIVTPTATTEASALERVMRFWRSLGCRLETMDPETHDRAVALVSHVPHVVASVQVNAVCAAAGGDVLRVAGPGFRDCTRVALGAPEMWAEILSENGAAVRAGLAAVRRGIEEVEAKLAAGADLTGMLEEARRWRAGVGPGGKERRDG